MDYVKRYVIDAENGTGMKEASIKNRIFGKVPKVIMWKMHIPYLPCINELYLTSKRRTSGSDKRAGYLLAFGC